MFSHNTSKRRCSEIHFFYGKIGMIKKKMTQAFMDDCNFPCSILFPSMRSERFFWFNDSINIISKLSQELLTKIIIIAFQLCFVRIAIIIETGIEKGGHKKIMKLNFPCKVVFQFTSSCCVLKFSVRSILFTLFLFKIFSILFKQTTTIPISFC